MNILYLGTHDWHSIRQRPQQLALGLAARHRVLFVNPPRSLRHHLRSYLYSAGRDFHFAASENGQCPNLHLYQSPPLFPWGFYLDPVNRLNYQLLSILVGQQIRHLRFEKPVLWLTHPFAIDLVNQVPHSLCCYDSMDDYPQFYAESSPLRARLEQAELKLYRMTDLVFASSKRLYQKAVWAGANVHLIPNGADVEHFQSEPDCPADLQALGHPVIGYVGTIGRWLDQELIEWIARRQPTWQWVLIGPVETNVHRLTARPNIHILGRRSYHDLPAYLAHFDVCTIPFKVNPMTWAVDPVKLYEYLAAGKPVVSTPLPEVERHRSLCHIASTPAMFLDALSIALAEQQHDSETHAALKKYRVEFARANSWACRVAQIESILTAHLTDS